MKGSSTDSGAEGQLDPAVFEAYNATRDAGVDTGVACHAPAVNLNFEQNGNVTACCYNRSHVLGTYPAQSLAEIWSGEPVAELRSAIRALDFSKGCELCLGQLRAGNYAGAHLRHFDVYGMEEDSRPFSDEGSPDFPRVMEFELTNTCNLECVMCTGYYSSMIRKHREKLPPLVSPYDDAFVDQLEPFLPHLREAKFLGGEPFLTPIYYAIWERIRTENPRLPLSVTTNGTTRNAKVDALLEALDFRLILSIDSFERDTYEAIRKRARYDDVMENLRFFRDYMHAKGEPFWLTVCPMQQNWRELPAIVDECNASDTRIYFNTVLYPAECSLRTLPAAQLEEVLALFRAYAPVVEHDWQRRNCACLVDLTHQIDGWLQVAREKERAADRLVNPEIVRFAPDAWTLRRHRGAKASATVDRAGDLLAIRRSGAPRAAPWEVHVFQPVALQQGVEYVLRFRVRADEPSPIVVTAKLGRPPWDSAGLYQELTVGPEWQSHELRFHATDSSPSDRISFELGAVSGGVEIGAVALSTIEKPREISFYERHYPV